MEGPQDPVGHTSAPASSQPLDLLDRLGNGCIGGHAIHVKDLISPKAKKVQNGPRNAGHPIVQVEVQQEVQPAPVPDGPV
jgi:hypothetical protein